MEGASGAAAAVARKARAEASSSTREAEAVPLAQRADPLANAVLDAEVADTVAQPLLQGHESGKNSPTYSERDVETEHAQASTARVELVTPPENVEDYGIPLADSTWDPEAVSYTRPKWPVAGLIFSAGTLFTGVAFLSLLDDGASSEDDREPWMIALIIFSILYLVESLMNLRTFLNMEHTGTHDPEHEYFVAIRQRPPRLVMHAECYHYETRVRSVRESYQDANGNTHHRTRHETYQEKVVTCRYSEAKHYASWMDLSGAGPRLAEVNQKYVGILVHVKKKLECDDPDTETDLESQAQRFRDRYRNRDSHFDYRESLEIDGFRPTVFLHDASRTPVYIGPKAYVIATLLLCSWPYRVYVQTHIMHARFTLRSLISARANAFTAVPDAIVQD
ncbi:Transmembrane protein 151-like [Hondaea fermentalgiana]|uniref:Transmembrane protein 151-like n=1 Tax=Hondaea fermentalgiana TaxID=2315210 RepID=A0A2R5H1L6_9STRA|nr:Transmembrane protein 151-like [Hondaea fermentalgiana]|eukprot:GBG34701.1 Transmembrane protein 151-like [Hondaea fermentalgiana]